ncbi:MAG TPA: ATP-binding protein [Tepidisphaeraceae bacterium]|jgi:PAS domain S-box-containing protein|nr:ATP-binding protein [Tepidisphaeraceae bacterium]
MTFNPPRQLRIQKVVAVMPSVTCAIVALVAILALVGWVFEIEILKSVLNPRRVAMNPATALSLVLLAISIWLRRKEPSSRGQKLTATIMAAIALAIALERLSQSWFPFSIHFDRILFASHLGNNTMAPNTAIALMLLSIGMVILDFVTREKFHPAQILIISAGCVGLLSLTGYLYRTSDLYEMRGFIPMAINTALGFVLLSVGALCSRPERQPLAGLLNDTLGGVVARRLVPAAFIVPLAIGQLQLLGSRLGLYDAEFGLGVLVLADILVFNLLIWWCATAMRASDMRRRITEQVLIESEERHRAILQQAAEGIYLVDIENKRVLDYNVAMERMLGYGHGEANHKLVYDFVADDQTNVDMRLEQLARSEVPLHGERQYRRKDGSLIDIEASAVMISYGGRRVACTVAHDITARKRAEQELREAVRSEREAHQQLKDAQGQLVQSEKMAGLGQMVAGVAHEINNPLSFVSNNVAVLQRDVRGLSELLSLYAQADAVIAERNGELLAQIRELSERMDLVYTQQNIFEMLTRSREGLRRIQQIVKDLRDFARLDESDLHEVDLNAGIQSTVNIVQGKAKKKRVEVALELGPLPLITCYPAKINQVVMNLVSNAIDASPEGGRVIVKSVSEDSRVRISVMDHGAGVPREIWGRIFDPFFTTKPIGEGTGLGLSISYGIVRDHGGTIEVGDATGGGAKFEVVIPKRCEPKAGEVRDGGIVERGGS